MKATPRGAMSRRAVLCALLAILALVVLLRVFNTGHVLMYDEAWNANSVADLATGHTEDLFYNNILRHPPLYTGLGALYGAASGADRFGVVIAMQLISLLSALGLACAIFFCGRDWFDERVGLAAAFFFAVMPAARAFDSLAKQESMTMLFVMLFFLFFFRGRHLVAGAMLGLAMLTKEIFLFPLAALFVFLVISRRRDSIKGFFVSVGAGALISFWWYAFISISSGEFISFYLGRSQVSLNWREPWHFFAGRLPADIGWVTLALGAIGVVFLIAYARRHGWPGAASRAGSAFAGEPDRPGGLPGRQWEMALFLLIWIVTQYVFISLSVGKSPWLMYSSLPAFAILGGWGLRETARSLEARPALRRTVVGLALAGALALSLPLGFYAFMRKADRTYEKSMAYKAVADYMNERMPRDGRIMLRLNDLGPNLLFYLDSYKPGSVYLLDEEPDTRKESELTGGYTVTVLRTETDAAQVLAHAELSRPVFLVMRPGFESADGVDPAMQLASLSRPVEIDGIWIFDWRSLREAIGRYANP